MGKKGKVFLCIISLVAVSSAQETLKNLAAKINFNIGTCVSGIWYRNSDQQYNDNGP